MENRCKCGYEEENQHALDCPYQTSPKEEIVNDWESEFDLLFYKEKDETAYWKHEIQYNAYKSFISSLLSSTEKRVAKDIIGKIEKMEKDYAYNGLLNAKQIINLIKSKYE